MDDDDDTLMTPAEVAEKFRVDPKTVTRWNDRGWLPGVRTYGGHRRFRTRDVKQALKHLSTSEWRSHRDGTRQ